MKKWNWSTFAIGTLIIYIIMFIVCTPWAAQGYLAILVVSLLAAALVTGALSLLTRIKELEQNVDRLEKRLWELSSKGK